MRHEDIDCVHIDERIWIREQNQAVDKEIQDVFKCLKFQTIPELLSLINQNLAKKPLTPLRVSQLDTTSTIFRCRAEAISSGLGAIVVPQNLPSHFLNMFSSQDL